jgi:hypothetical protein
MENLFTYMSVVINWFIIYVMAYFALGTHTANYSNRKKIMLSVCWASSVLSILYISAIFNQMHLLR